MPSDSALLTRATIEFGCGQYIRSREAQQAVTRIDQTILTTVVTSQVFAVVGTVVLERQAVKRVVEVRPR